MLSLIVLRLVRWFDLAVENWQKLLSAKEHTRVTSACGIAHHPYTRSNWLQSDDRVCSITISLLLLLDYRTRTATIIIRVSWAAHRIHNYSIDDFRRVNKNWKLWQNSPIRRISIDTFPPSEVIIHSFCTTERILPFTNNLGLILTKNMGLRSEKSRIALIWNYRELFGAFLRMDKNQGRQPSI